MRPRNLDEFVGQNHVVGEGTSIRHALENDRMFSMILWGPPGCGKTTLARIFANETRCHFLHFSAVLSGIKEIRSVIEDAKNQQTLFRKRTVLFVDEIHRFNKSQQDAFLHHVESGLITLIGATTQNPSFEVIPALMSRCRVITLNSLSEGEIKTIIDRAVKDKERGLGNINLVVNPEARSHIIRIADGDGRVALNGLEIVASMVVSEQDPAHAKTPVHITLQDIERALEKKALLYDKSGEEHYNLISAFHKSMRGSDPDASVYWLGRMLSAGEDPMYIARRMVRFASEDIGNADPFALGIAQSAMEAFKFLGHPEGELALAQAAIYMATAPKSNSIYDAYGKVKESIDRSGALPVPFHIRNAPTELMKALGYGKGYKYAHDYAHAYVPQDYLPKALQGQRYYVPTNRGYEKTIKEMLRKWRRLKEQEKKTKKGTDGDKD
ncbi:MAG: replication-associated recombination protein A [Desulfobacterales bacterium]|nr:MAG: replication-associated recombination protein A [Desulfobacterales bacterium]